MSAYMVERGHIVFLVQSAMDLRLSWVWDVNYDTGHYAHMSIRVADYDVGARVGQMLWDENHASVCHRYKEGDLPGPADQDFRYADQHPGVHFTFDPPQIIKACDCFEYQSCEHPGWQASEACAFIRSLHGVAAGRVKGYEEATWGAPKPTGAIPIMSMIRARTEPIPGPPDPEDIPTGL